MDKINATEIYKATEPENLSILFLSERFEEADKLFFYNICQKLIINFTNAMPFIVLKNKISAWAYFTYNIGDISTYKFFLEAKGWYETNDQDLIVNMIKNLQVYPVGSNSLTLPMEAEHIWLDRSKKNHKLVCMIIKDFENRSCCYAKRWTGDPEYRNLYPFISLCLNGYKDDNNKIESVYENSDEFLTAFFLHEIGHYFGLADEYEEREQSGVYNNYTYDEPIEPNATLLKTIVDESSNIQVDKIKWKSLIRDLSIKVKQYNHPLEDSSPQYENILKDSESKIIVLSHMPAKMDPNDPSKIIDNYCSIQYINHINPDNAVKSKRQLLSNIAEPQLFEGSKLYRHDIFRPSAECTMRNHVYFKNNKPQTFPEFCRVCDDHIKNRLKLMRNFNIGNLIFIPNPVHQKTIIQSRFATEFYNFIKVTKDDYNNIDCFYVTIRRFERFFKEKICWETYSIPIDLSQVAGLSYEKLGGQKILYPLLGLTIWPMHYLCMNRLLKQKSLNHTEDRKIPHQYAGAGLVGAVQMNNFGRVENDCLELDTMKIGDKTFEFFRQPGFTDFDCLNVGSLLQFWPSVHTYKLIVLYVTEQISMEQLITESLSDSTIGSLYQEKPEWKPKIINGEPYIVNYCLVFMGKTNEGKFLVADNIGVDSLLEKWQNDFKFCLASQWWQIRY